MSLTERQSQILEDLCHEYIERAIPVSSQFLKEKFNFPFSPATIRAEFNQLENQRYLFHPFVSSGKVPTDKGYRFFVDKILERENFIFPKSKIKLIEEILSQLEDLEDFLKISNQMTKALSNLCSNLVLSYFPQEDILWKEGWERVVKEPEFQDADYMKEFMEDVANFERNIEKLEEEEGKITVYIGRENPFKGKEMSIIISGICLPKKKQGIVAILGPKRMDFERNIPLIDYFFNKNEKTRIREKN